MRKIICDSCRYARKSHGSVVACKSIGYIELATLYGRCRKYEPRDSNKSDKYYQLNLFGEDGRE